MAKKFYIEYIEVHHFHGASTVEAETKEAAIIKMKSEVTEGYTGTKHHTADMLSLNKIVPTSIHDITQV